MLLVLASAVRDQIVAGLASAVILEPESRGTHDHILLYSMSYKSTNKNWPHEILKLLFKLNVAPLVVLKVSR
jgi:hypothetical protein